MAPVSDPRYRDWDGLTGGGIVNIISYWPASQRTHWYDARICLGETQTNTLNHLIFVTVSRCCAGRNTGEPVSSI